MNKLKGDHPTLSAAMGSLELALAAAIVVLSGVSSGVPFAAFGRTRDARLLLVGLANLALLALGILWLYGELPIQPPAYAATTLPALAAVTFASACLLATGIIRRRG